MRCDERKCVLPDSRNPACSCRAGSTAREQAVGAAASDQQGAIDAAAANATMQLLRSGGENHNSASEHAGENDVDSMWDNTTTIQPGGSETVLQMLMRTSGLVAVARAAADAAGLTQREVRSILSHRHAGGSALTFAVKVGDTKAVQAVAAWINASTCGGGRNGAVGSSAYFGRLLRLAAVRA